nr:lipid droplet-associated hydrolase [Peromyscus maniculatus bairdii]
MTKGRKATGDGRKEMGKGEADAENKCKDVGGEEKRNNQNPRRTEKRGLPVLVKLCQDFCVQPHTPCRWTEPNAQEIEDIYGLNGQIEHKIAFLRAHVPKDVKIILIGHSIGSYISLQVMKHAPELPAQKLHEPKYPVISGAATPWQRGHLCSITSPPFLSQAQFCDVRVLLQQSLNSQESPFISYSEDLWVHIPALLWNVAIAECSMAKLATSETNAAYLGGQEMIQVRKRADEIIKEHLPKLTFYYGRTDGWCPVKYYEDMKKDFPEGDIRLCEKGISHAFVLGFSQEVAAIVADWMNHKLPKI